MCNVRQRMIYDILREGDRHLRGKIAELVFDRIWTRIFEGPLYCCTTQEIYNFLSEFLLERRAKGLRSINIKTYIETQINNYIATLNKARELLGLQNNKETVNLLSDGKVKKNLLYKKCLLCWKEGEAEIRIRIKGYYHYFWLCKDCLKVALDKGVVQPKSGTSSSYKVVTSDQTLVSLIRSLINDASSIEHYFSKHADAIEVLTRLDEQALNLLNEGRPKCSGQYSFDYICVDNRGNKYLVDVTSVRGLDATPAPLSKKEKQIAKLARIAGFKILVPVVKFLHDWRVLIELMEVS